MSAVGREAELEAIGAALEAAGPHPAVLVITGEAGIGKTAVWEHAAAMAADRGYLVLRCTPGQSEAWLTFSGLADLLDQVPGHIVSSLPAPQRDALETALLKRAMPESGTDFRAVCVATAHVIRCLASSRPVMIAIDDGHWLDLATTRVLEFVTRRLGGQPVAIALSGTSGWGQLPPLGLDRLPAGHRVIPVRLGPLSWSALHQVVQARCGVALAKPQLLRVHAACGGNPRLGCQIAEELSQRDAPLAPGDPVPLPPGLASLVASRMSCLPAPDRAGLLLAAAVAYPALPRIRAAVAGGGSRLFEAAEDAGIIEIKDGHIHFQRPFLPEVIYASASPVRRRHAHRCLAATAMRPHARAWHAALAICGPDADVAGALEQAGRAAQVAFPHTAARLWELAARRTPSADAASMRRRSSAAAACLLGAGDLARARSMLETVLAKASPGGERARVWLELATAAYCDSGPRQAAALCRRGLTEAAGDPWLTASLRLRAAWFADHDTAGRVRDAGEAAAALSGAQSGAAAELLAGARAAAGYYGFLAGQGRGAAGLAAATVHLPGEDGSWEAQCGRFTAALWATCFDPQRARAELARLLHWVTHRQQDAAEPHVLTRLAEVECWLGDWDGASAHAAQAMSSASQTGQRRVQNLALAVQALLDAQRGQVDAACRAAEAGLASATAADDPWAAGAHLVVLGFAALSQRQFLVADRCLSHADELMTAMGLAEPAGHRFHADHIEAVATRGELARAAGMAERLTRRAAAAPYPWLSIAAARSRATVAAAGGDLDTAAASIGEALRAHDGAHLPFEHGRTLLAAGQIRRRRKEKLLAEEALLAAERIFRRLGARPWAARAVQELGRLGLRRSAWLSLTPSEEQVARMVASGLTNREVASALFISHKTVEANLSRIFRKLGIRSRRELRDDGLLRAVAGTAPVAAPPAGWPRRAGRPAIGTGGGKCRDNP